MPEFDYQWRSLLDPGLQFTEDRVNEFLSHVQLPPDYFKGKLCLDAGCGSGRFTYAMRQLGAIVDSLDVSSEAVRRCEETNPYARVCDIRTLPPSRLYDFVFCWGVLHHLENPREGFEHVVSQVRYGGVLHVMIYHEEVTAQSLYTTFRRDWHKLTNTQKLLRAQAISTDLKQSLHGWWDALNPVFAWGFSPDDVRGWFEAEGFDYIQLVHRQHIQMRGRKAR